jgi:hypothetical protein
VQTSVPTPLCWNSKIHLTFPSIVPKFSCDAVANPKITRSCQENRQLNQRPCLARANMTFLKVLMACSCPASDRQTSYADIQFFAELNDGLVSGCSTAMPVEETVANRDGSHSGCDLQMLLSGSRHFRLSREGFPISPPSEVLLCPIP